MTINTNTELPEFAERLVELFERYQRDGERQDAHVSEFNWFVQWVKKEAEKLAAANLSHEHDHAGISAYSIALFGRDDIGFTDGVRRIATLTTALAAAKEALEAVKLGVFDHHTVVDNALARIAECEKETT